VRELAAFAKVHLAPGEATTVALELDDRSFSWWDVGTEGHAAVVDRLPLRPPGGVGEVRPPGWRADPSGRLPVTFPERIEHAPAFGNFPGGHGEVRYGEGVLVGYRWYEARHLPVRFPFGHGLSYTTFELGEPEVIDGDPMLVRVRVTNTGTRSGGEVVQLYVVAVSPKVVRPPKELKAFAKVWLEAGGSATVTLGLTDRAFAHWQPDPGPYEAIKDRQQRSTISIAPAASEQPPKGWHVEAGEYRLHCGRSSADIAHVVSITITP
jgi:hypothetical protein